MAKKKTPVIKIDQRTEVTGGGLPFLQEDTILPPASPSIEGPTNLIFVSQGIIRSTQAPKAFVSIAWDAVIRVSPEYYSVEWAENSSFTNALSARAYGTSATVQDLKVSTTYYFRVRAVLGGIFSDWSNTLSVAVTSDPTVPPNVTSFAGSFIKSDLVLTWVKPTGDEVYKDLEIKIYDSTHSILYGTFYSGSQQFTWTAEQNLTATSNVGAISVQVDIRSRSWSNVLSTSPQNITVNAPTLPTPTPTSNWVGDSPLGIADEDLIISGLSYTEIDSYDITLDSILYTTKEPRFTYRYDRNVLDHTPTLASGDPSIGYIVQGRTRINKTSPTAIGTWINAAPSGSLLTLSTVVGFSQIAAQVTVSQIIQDFDHFEWTLAVVSGAITQQFISSTPDVIMLASGSGNYQVSVKAVDKFNQKSGAVVSSILTIDALTIGELRAECSYIDDLNTNVATLKTAMSDDNRSSGGISYINGGSWVHWIRFTRPLLERYRTITLAMFFSLGVSGWYIRTSIDGITWRYFSGPVTSGRIITEVASEIAARAAAISAATLGNSTASRVDLPTILEARYIEVWLRNTTDTTRVDEFYPRRLVQSDDIEAETIKGINIAASTITADKMSVIELSAITANIGGLVINTGGYLWQGSGTPASPTTGLKIFNSSGVGKLSTYNSGVEQVTLDTDGRFKAGAGKVILDANGVAIEAVSASSWFYDSTKSIVWKDTGGTNKVAAISTFYDSFVNALDIRAFNDGTKPSQIQLKTVQSNNADGAVIQMSGSAKEILMTGGSGFFLKVDGGLNVNTTGAGAGDVFASGRGSFIRDATYQDEIGALVVSRADNTNKRVFMGYDSTKDYGFIGCVQTGTSYKPIAINGNSGNSVILPSSNEIPAFGIDTALADGSITIANNGTATPFGNANNFSGMFIVNPSTINGNVGLFVTGGASIALASASVANLYTTTAGTASRINVYLNGGGAVVIENKLGSSLTLKVFAIRTRTSQ